MQWFGKKIDFTRFLGEVDQDDPTNLPSGCGAVAENVEFALDNGNVTSATTRAGVNLAIQGKNPAAITGLEEFIYQPELPTDITFERPIYFDAAGDLQYEFPVGTGRSVSFPLNGVFTPPAQSHMLAAITGNQVYAAFSNLKTPTSIPARIDPKALTVQPLGMKPFGWTWTANTAVLEGEVCTPAVPVLGNGHTYRAMNTGYTGAAQPNFPIPDASTVMEANVPAGQTPVEWEEYTMVIANRLPPPSAPVLSIATGTVGTFPSAQTVSIILTFTNGVGETIGGAIGSITTTADNQAVEVSLPSLESLPLWLSLLAAPYAITGINVYEADVASGDPAPPQSDYNFVGGGFSLGSQMVVAGTAGGLGTQYPGSGGVEVVDSFGPGGGTSYSGVISGFASEALAAGTSLTIKVNGSIVPSGPGGAGAIEYQTSPDSGATWNNLLTFSENGVQPVTWVTVPLPGSPANIDTFQLRIEITGGAPPGYDVEIQGSISQAYITIPSANSSPPTANTARITPGQLPAPLQGPATQMDPGSGAFAAGRDVYTVETFTNSAGETTPGPASSVINTTLDASVLATLVVPLDDNNEPLYDILQVGLYEADVATGAPAPPISAFRLVGYYSSFLTGGQISIDGPAAGANPPTANTTGPGGNIQADTATGGLNSSQGLRYGSVCFVDSIETFSGFTLASVVSYDVDEDGWELAVFRVAPGPSYVVARSVNFSIADGTQDGPFRWVGDLNLLIPTQNFVYPGTEPVGSANYTSTLFNDNVATQGVFNFDDTYLATENDVTDRLQVIAPPQCCRVDYLETADVIVLTGVNGLNGGGLASISTDYESFRGDLGPIPIAASGETCFGFTDKFKGIIMAIRSASGYAVTPSTGGASGWAARRRWGGEGASQGVGACGYKAWAACSKFIIVVNEKGVYKYEDADDDSMSKETPRRWAQVNWAYKHTIEVYIDEGTKQVLIAVPTGASTVPDLVIALSYLEGWQSPIHFSSFSQKEITLEAARRYSYQNIQCNVIRRVQRTLPAGPAYIDGPDWTTMPNSSFGVNQLLFGSSGADGGISARTPGIYRDNGAGIPCRYRPVSAGLMQAVCKPEGFNLNACGQGLMTATFYAARDMSDGQGGKTRGIKVARDIPLTPDQQAGITRKVPPKVNEYWSVEFSNNAQPDCWFSLKTMTVYVIPVTGGRGELDKGT